MYSNLQTLKWEKGIPWRVYLSKQECFPKSLPETLRFNYNHFNSTNLSLCIIVNITFYVHPPSLYRTSPILEPKLDSVSVLLDRYPPVYSTNTWSTGTEGFDFQSIRGHRLDYLHVKPFCLSNWFSRVSFSHRVSVLFWSLATYSKTISNTVIDRSVMVRKTRRSGFPTESLNWIVLGTNKRKNTWRKKTEGTLLILPSSLFFVIIIPSIDNSYLNKFRLVY